MTFLPKLAFAEKGLAVRYRASSEPQRVAVRVDVPWPQRGPYGDRVHVAMYRFVSSANQGVSSGAEFDPRTSSVRMISGPGAVRKPVPPACDYVWELEVTAIAPKAIRVLIDHLANNVNINAMPTSVSIEGSLPLDASPLSITEREVIAWLNASEDYPEEWGSPPFQVVGRKGKKDAVIRLVAAGAVTKAAFDAFEHGFDGLISAVFRYPDRKHKSSGEYSASTYARTKSEISTVIKGFTYDSEYYRAAVVNFLCRFHQDVLPLREVELTFP